MGRNMKVALITKDDAPITRCEETVQKRCLRPLRNSRRQNCCLIGPCLASAQPEQCTPQWNFAGQFTSVAWKTPWQPCDVLVGARPGRLQPGHHSISIVLFSCPNTKCKFYPVRPEPSLIPIQTQVLKSTAQNTGFHNSGVLLVFVAVTMGSHDLYFGPVSRRLQLSELYASGEPGLHLNSTGLVLVSWIKQAHVFFPNSIQVHDNETWTFRLACGS